MLLEHERSSGLGMDALVTYALGHQRDHGLGTDALDLVTVCSWNTNIILVLARML